MANICANCKYYLLKKYSYLPNEHLCTHPQSKQIGLVSGNTYYQDCKDIREQFTMASKYGGLTYNCELYAEIDLYIENCRLAPSRKFIVVWENDAVAKEMQALLDEFEIYWHKLADACYMAEAVGKNDTIRVLLNTIDTIFLVEITDLPIRTTSPKELKNIHNDCPSLYENSAKSDLEYTIKQYREQGAALPNLKQ